MAFISPDNHTLTEMSDRIMPGVRAMSDRARAEGVPIKDARLNVNHLDDDIELCIRYTLASRGDMNAVSPYDLPYEMGRRIQSAMRLLHRTPQAKAICVDRRRLIARGEKFRKEAPRKLKKVQ